MVQAQAALGAWRQARRELEVSSEGTALCADLSAGREVPSARSPSTPRKTLAHPAPELLQSLIACTRADPLYRISHKPTLAAVA